MLGAFLDRFLDFLLQLVIFIPGLAIGVILHEYAHGYIALKSGDTTARDMGRLTLNPIAHIDIFGSILLPLLLILLNSNIVFGYAKPVSINPSYFRDYRKGMRYTSLAGPVTNLLVAFGFGLIYGLFIYILNATGFEFGDLLSQNLGQRVVLVINQIFLAAVNINIFLAIFNFLPIPPLDGSKILASFLPDSAMYRYLSLGRFGFIFIFIILFLGGNVFWRIVSPVIGFLRNAALWWQYLI